MGEEQWQFALREIDCVMLNTKQEVRCFSPALTCLSELLMNPRSYLHNLYIPPCHMLSTKAGEYWSINKKESEASFERRARLFKTFLTLLAVEIAGNDLIFGLHYSQLKSDT